MRKLSKSLEKQIVLGYNSYATTFSYLLLKGIRYKKSVYSCFVILLRVIVECSSILQETEKYVFYTQLSVLRTAYFLWGYLKWEDLKQRRILARI